MKEKATFDATAGSGTLTLGKPTNAVTHGSSGWKPALPFPVCFPLSETGCLRAILPFVRRIRRVERTRVAAAVITLLLSLGATSAETKGLETIPERIVSTAPSITEIVFALGEQDRLVGVTSFCVYPPEAQEKTIVGDFASPNMEVVLNLRPDLVVVLADRRDLAEKLHRLGMDVIAVRQDTLEDVLESIQLLGRRLGAEQRAEALVERLRSGLQDLQLRRESQSEQAPSVLLVVSRLPGSLSEIYTVGRRSYLHQLLEVAGGRNVFGDLPVSYVKVSLEEILRRDPEIILDLSHEHDDAPDSAASTGPWQRITQLRAVRQGRVRFVDDTRFVVPGPRMLAAARELADLLASLVKIPTHPDAK